MEYVEEYGNIETEYLVYYDKEKLTELLDKIVKNVSYRTDGDFDLPYDTEFIDNIFISKPILPNGDPMYENVERIYYYTSNSSNSFHNDSIAVKGTKVTSPELAFIIKGLISDDPDSIYEFLEYEDSSELVSIDDKIAITNRLIDKIDNFDFRKKIYAIETLKQYCEEKRDKKYFDTELLKQYYLQARSLIEFEQISKTERKKGKRILLTDYKQSNL